MIKLSNNRGVSEIVSSVLLIIISVVSVSLIFVYVINYSKTPLTLSPQNCIDMQSNPPITVSYSCFNSATGDIEVKLSRGVDSYKLDSLKASISYDSKSSSWSCENSCSSCSILESGNSKYYYISSKEKPTSLELFIDDCAKIDIKKIDDC